MARILLLIPHPDDEVVGAAASIARRRAAGDAFVGLYLTSGVAPPENQWPWDRPRRQARVERRRAEARAVAAALGIEPLEFRDCPSRMLKTEMAEVAALITRTLRDHAIDAIWTPAWEGGHQDHDITNFLAAKTAGGRPVIEFAEYNRAGGTVQANRFARPNGSEIDVVLTPAESAMKQNLLAMYRSERTNLVMTRAVVESQRPLPAHDYARPPHDGTLFREQFHWVRWFVRHPGVDFEPSSAIYDAIRAFR